MPPVDTQAISHPSSTFPDPNSSVSQTRTSSRHIRGVVDRFAHVVVWIGGISTIISILGIFVYLVLEVTPLFTAPSDIKTGSPPIGEVSIERPQSIAVGIDEYQEVGYVIQAGGELSFFHMPSGQPLAVDIPKFQETEQVTAVTRTSSSQHIFGLGTSHGSVIPLTINLAAHFKDRVRTVVPTATTGTPIQADPTRQSIVRLAYQQSDEGTAVAVLTETGQLWYSNIQEPSGLVLIDEPTMTQVELVDQPTNSITTLLLDGLGEILLIGSADGRLFHWDLQEPEQPRLVGTYVAGASDNPITALSYLIGDRSFVVGTQTGTVSVWMPVRDLDGDGAIRLQPTRRLASHAGTVTSISPSQRDKGFLTADTTDSVFLHHSTSAQTLLQIPVTDSPIRAMMFSPKANGVIAIDEAGHLQTWTIENSHPEITFRTLFRPILYEGYEQPEHIWQSSSGSDDFEPKFGMVPLIFGTLKGTFYAMLFAVPLAVMGAIYTAMFMHANLRAVIKPVIEIMAALPSVVLGFLAGLWLAPLLERILPAVVVMLLVIPLSVVFACILWQLVPSPIRNQTRSGLELTILISVIIGMGLLCLTFNQQIESWLFASDYKQWMHSIFDVRYDQRNALVITLAMGFAVIPIIFSISEDSLSNVPKHLIAGSLAMGATQWQTLTRLVLISASPGIFSALMIGFGRAVGETMIVLMATGNTPILDWSVFNGFRTLSANIAVEMPEAPHGGTLYRVLFLSGLLLFAFTFFINTIAEIVRQRLRTRYSQF